MRDAIKLNEFVANRGLPETSEELIAEGRMLIISVSGETLTLKPVVHRMREDECDRVANLAGHSKLVVSRSDLGASP